MSARSVDSSTLKSNIQPLSLTVDGSKTIFGIIPCGGFRKKGVPLSIASANTDIQISRC